MAAKRSQIEPYADEGRGPPRPTLYAMEHVSLMLAVCQFGITVCSLLIGNIAEPAIHHLLVGPLSALGSPRRCPASSPSSWPSASSRICTSSSGR